MRVLLDVVAWRGEGGLGFSGCLCEDIVWVREKVGMQFQNVGDYSQGGI